MSNSKENELFTKFCNLMIIVNDESKYHQDSIIAEIKKRTNDYFLKNEYNEVEETELLTMITKKMEEIEETNKDKQKSSSENDLER